MSVQLTMANGTLLDVLMITCNRPQYTALALERLLATCDDSMRVWVWHNGQDVETREVVESFRAHPRLHRVVFSQENRKLREPTNWFWQESDGRFLAKVDDDCLVEDRWASTLMAALKKHEELGILACWHFYQDDFVPDIARPKVRQLAEGCAVLLNCWVQGSGYVMRREVFDELGSLRETETFTDYCLRASLAGWINGWHLPLVHIEHMDDPRSKYSRFSSEEDFQRDRPLSAINHGVETLEQWRRRARWMARSLQTAPYDPRLYVGWRAKVRQGLTWLKRRGGWQEPWRTQN